MSKPYDQQALDLPIISDILGPIDRGKVLVLLYEAAARWLSLILTIVSELVREGYVVAVTTFSKSDFSRNSR